VTTVGYGDYAPPDDTGRLISIAFLLIGVVVIGGILSAYTKYVIKQIEKRAEEHQMVAQEAALWKGHEGGDDQLSKEEVITLNRAVRLKQQWWNLKFAVFSVVGCVAGGAVVMRYWMGWSTITAFYWAMVTSMTVGYGDLAIPKDQKVHLFCSFYMLFSTMTVSISVGKVIQVFSEWEREAQYDAMMRNLNLNVILNKFKGAQDYKVSQDEFVLFMLQQTMGLNYNKDILPFVKKFVELDEDKSGYLNSNDLEIFAANVEKQKEKEEQVRENTRRSSVTEIMKRRASYIFQGSDAKVAVTGNVRGRW